MGDGGFLLDTNAIIEIFARRAEALAPIKLLPNVFVPSIAVGELFLGAYRSRLREENIRRLRDFVREASVLPCDELTSEYYGRIGASLRRKGRPIPQNDLWIAALALQYDLTLISRDGHFDHVDGLQRVSLPQR